MAKKDLLAPEIGVVKLPLLELADHMLNETDCFFCGTPLQQRPIQYEVMGESVLVTAELPGFYCDGCDEEYPHTEILAAFYSAAADTLEQVKDKKAKLTRRCADFYLAGPTPNL